MPKYAYVVYINPAATGPTQLPEKVDAFQGLCWEQSALVRWRCADPANIAASLSDTIPLVCVDCDADAGAVKKACQDVRASCVSPILLLDPGTLREGIRQNLMAIASPAEFIGADALSDPDAICVKLRQLAVVLPEPRVVLNYEQNDLVMREMIPWVGERRLANDIQKFFPDATSVQLRPVAGGWSGAKLCRLFVQGQEYFLKFFDDSRKFRSEHQRHGEAQKWLRVADADVPIQLVPDVGDGLDSQVRAFPATKPAVLPVCYVSASAPGTRRETLKELYRTTDDDYLRLAFKRLLEVLGTGQRANLDCLSEPLWALGPQGAGFRLADKAKIRVLATLDDLGMYGPSMCGHDEDVWFKHARVLELFLLKMPNWLSDACLIARGLIHGDPNPRNCLVSSEAPGDLRLIDCGDYEENGRLVSDLALIERDIKLVLMGTEKAVGGFFDLDTRQLTRWWKAERNCIEKGIDYKEDDVPSQPCRSHSSVRRA
jgi:hypothetical protein